MSNNSRFTVAVHTLTLLAQSRGEPVTSELIASSVNTNPVVIRRVLGALREGHLVTSQGGNGGGWKLAQCAEKITLQDIYRAVEEEDEPIFPLHHRSPNAHCTVGRHIQQALNGHFDAAKRALEEELARVSVADILGEVLAAAG